jgi:SAM-dependent methyltransferase
MGEIDRRLELLAPRRMLDVATGRGSGAAWLESTFEGDAPIVCADISSRAFSGGGKAFESPRALPVVCDARSLSLASDSIDLVAVVNSLHHFSDPAAALEDMRRVAAPGGALVVAEMHRETSTAAQETHMLLHHWWAACDRLLGRSHGDTFTRRELRSLLEGIRPSGLLVEEQDVGGHDPHDPGVIAGLEASTDRYLQRLVEHGEAEELRKRGLGLRCRLREEGFSPAPRVILLALL